ncbi:MAG: hypothetical protein LBR95_01545 [Azoarcus sp.]|nr:hypothetical protein [Azoarcus sp.]
MNKAGCQGATPDIRPFCSLWGGGSEAAKINDPLSTIWSRALPDARIPPKNGVDTAKRQLIDHILFTQALSGVPGFGAGGVPVVIALCRRLSHNAVAILRVEHRKKSHAARNPQTPK